MVRSGGLWKTPSVPVLSKMLKGSEKVAILVSDISRPCPSHLFLPTLLEELSTAGIRNEQILIVFGLGNHRTQTPDEMKYLVGENVFKHYECIDPNRDDCSFLGTTTEGTPVEVFRRVAEADFVIGTGNLEIHYCAGYSGGNKALLPGVCSLKTINANHVKMMDPRVAPGKLDGNPMRLDIEDAGKIGGVKFILNVTLNAHKEIVGAVAGDPILAHREGIKLVDRMYKRVLPRFADVAIVSPGGFPKDIDLYQSQKGLDHASYAVKPGGAIILVARAAEGLGQKLFEEWM